MTSNTMFVNQKYWLMQLTFIKKRGTAPSRHTTFPAGMRKCISEAIMTEKHENKHKVPWYLWPFWAIWKLVVGIVAGTGRLVAVILGLVFLIVGVVLTITVVGAIVGVPFIIFGLLLMVRGLF
jgi:hypothetical protein